jgi:hypothetical protein
MFGQDMRMVQSVNGITEVGGIERYFRRIFLPWIARITRIVFCLPRMARIFTNGCYATKKELPRITRITRMRYLNFDDHALSV